MFTVYEFDISRATHATDLQVMREDILADDNLDLAEKAELLEIIRRKFTTGYVCHSEIVSDQS